MAIEVVLVTFTFTILLAWTLHSQRVEAERTQQRFCDVTASFIDSNLALRDSQNRASVVEVGGRGDLILTTQGVIKLLKNPSPRDPALTAVLLRYLQTENEVNRGLNEGAIDALGASDKAISTWESLKRRLRC